MKILVTGSTGFLGSAVVERLLFEGYNVVGLGRKDKGFLSKTIIEHGRFFLVRSDLLDEDAFKGVEDVDAVIHLASQQPSSQNIKFSEFLNVNVNATYRLLQAVKMMNAKRFIYTSTTSIFSNHTKDSPINELSYPDPINHYGLTKYIGERLVEIELQGSNINAVVLRFPSIYGKNHLGGFVHTFYTLARQGIPIELYSNGIRYRNLLYVEDAVELLMRLLRYDAADPFEIFCAGSPDSQMTITIATWVRDMIGSKSKIVPVNKIPANDRDVFIDISKLQNATGFTPCSIKDGLKKY